jgi:hypothetical protein
MRLRFGLPLMLLIWLATMALSYAISVPIYWPVVGAIALFCTRDAMRLDIPNYPTSFALPPLGILVVIAVAWPIAFPWYLRVRRLVRIGELQPGAPRIGWLGYGLAAASGAVAVLSIMATNKMKNSPLVATLTTTAQSVADACFLDLTVNIHNRRTLQLVLPPRFLLSQNEREAFSRRVAMAARRSYPNGDSLRAIDVIFMEVTQRGNVTQRREHASFAFTPRQLDIQPEGPYVEAADERFAREIAALIIADEPAGWEKYRLVSGAVDSSMSLDSVRASFRTWLPPRQPDTIQRVHCLSYHGRNGVRRTSLEWRVDSTRWLLDLLIRGADDSLWFTGAHITKY